MNARVQTVGLVHNQHDCSNTYIRGNGRVDMYVCVYGTKGLLLGVVMWLGCGTFMSSMKRGQCKYDYQPYANALC